MMTKPFERSNGFVNDYWIIDRYFIPGDSLMRRLDLYPRKTGYWNGYNSTVDPTISNNFATAAFRFAHTLIPVNIVATIISSSLLISVDFRYFTICANMEGLRGHKHPQIMFVFVYQKLLTKKKTKMSMCII